MSAEHAEMSVFQALLGRRSVRKFTDRPVDVKDLRRILEAGRWAPSGLNNQPWRFLVVRAGDPRQAALAGLTKYGHIVREAQALIVVFLYKPAMYHEGKDNQAAGACIQNLLLAVHGLGLGGVWLGEIINQEDQVMEALQLGTEEYRLMAVIALGHPAQPSSRLDAAAGSSRRPLEELLLEAL
ncbi:nitroreductase family protein [Desulfonatronum thiodismutans]|uniref:nitroreductase family protein n=1 Tax=Desulfonatronum thiodismutans TaxID=159290 RepID=UPI0004ABEA29|nr:nitroreductase family protein [Desulfonatronum thiodismutans]